MAPLKLSSPVGPGFVGPAGVIGLCGIDAIEYAPGPVPPVVTVALAVNDVKSLGQSNDGVAVAEEKVGLGSAVTVTTAVAEQPVAVDVPVTVYVVVTAGVTFTLAPLNEPGIQVYVSAPVALNVLLVPGHTAVGVAVGTTVTAGLIVTKIEVVDEGHPTGELTVTEYVPEVGAMIELETEPPGVQL